MRKCHIAGFAVIGASALVSATGIAEPPYLNPQFHTQEQSRQDELYALDCEYSDDEYDCWSLSAATYLFGDTFVTNVFLNEWTQAGTVYKTRGLYCPVSPDTLDVATGARAATFEVLIDIAKDGCTNEGYTVDYSSGEYGPYEFPNSMSIRALFSDPYNTVSTHALIHQSNQETFRQNLSCKSSKGEEYQDATVEINGSSKGMNFTSQASKRRCNDVVKP